MDGIASFDMHEHMHMVLDTCWMDWIGLVWFGLEFHYKLYERGLNEPTSRYPVPCLRSEWGTCLGPNLAWSKPTTYPEPAAEGE